MKLRIYQVPDHVSSDVVRPHDPEWRALDVIVKSWLYDLILVELRATVSSSTATARVISLAIEAVFRNNSLMRTMVFGRVPSDQAAGATSQPLHRQPQSHLL
jgi:hypothetical protein